MEGISNAFLRLSVEKAKEQINENEQKIKEIKDIEKFY